MRVLSILLLMAMSLFFMACPSKTVEEAVTQTEPEPVVKEEEPEDLSPCPKFRDAPNRDEAETNYVLYRDFLKANDINKAFELWKKVYAVAPAADGQRNSVYADGIYFYEYFMSQEKDPVKREAYVDRIFELYDEIAECYPNGGYSEAIKAFDLYYKYKDRATKEEIYALFKQSIDKDGMKTNDFVINPFTSLLVELHKEEKVSTEEAQKYQKIIRQIIEKGMKDCKGVACERWEIINSYAPVQLESFEVVKGFYDCAYYVDKYYPDYEENPKDCDVIRTVYSRLNWGGCEKSLEEMKTLVAVGNNLCVDKSGADSAYVCLQEGKYQCAIDEFKKEIEKTEDNDRKAKYLLLIAKIYNAHLKNFPRARQYALEAAEKRSGWGEPYILIGRLYASSGPLCGPGRGWDSQIVVWPAIDMWSKAKRIDPSVSAEANKWIGRYSQYMPKKEDVFIRNLKVGDSFRVGCWIQETTRIRTAD
ncbi:MAG: hypothetical protein MRY78_11165 [Saprospiraceae bacterium]|nr:hypothetical protein [Saprospiraceae bacterium]